MGSVQGLKIMASSYPQLLTPSVLMPAMKGSIPNRTVVGRMVRAPGSEDRRRYHSP